MTKREDLQEAVTDWAEDVWDSWVADRIADGVDDRISMKDPLEDFRKGYDEAAGYSDKHLKGVLVKALKDYHTESWGSGPEDFLSYKVGVRGIRAYETPAYRKYLKESGQTGGYWG